MASSNGKLASHTGSGARFMRAFVKRQTAKLARRGGKKLLDNAPRRVTRGYDD